MHTRTHKLLTLLLALAIAMAPLRGAWATAEAAPETVSSGNPSHCEQMQQGSPAESAVPVLHAGHEPAATDPEPCSHDCGGSCCDGACNACVHATPALSGGFSMHSGTTAGTLNSTPSQLFPERPAIPLLHPPASSRS